MDVDMELVYGTDNYEEIQEYFEHRKFDYPSGSSSMLDRLKNEYVPDVWEEIDETKRNRTSYRRQALDRILGILQEVPSNSKESSVSETKSEGQD